MSEIVDLIGRYNSSNLYKINIYHLFPLETKSTQKSTILPMDKIITGLKCKKTIQYNEYIFNDIHCIEYEDKKTQYYTKKTYKYTISPIDGLFIIEFLYHCTDTNFPILTNYHNETHYHISSYILNDTHISSYTLNDTIRYQCMHTLIDTNTNIAEQLYSFYDNVSKTKYNLPTN